MLDVKIPFSLLALSVVLASQIVSAEDRFPAHEYYPTAIGTEWVFQSGALEVVERVVAHELIGEDRCARIETVFNGKTIAYEHIAVREDGVYRVSIAGIPVEPPLCFLKYPAAKGEKWRVRSSVQGNEIKGEFVLGQTDVSVPSGEYPSITSEGKDFQSASTKLEFVYYFVKGIGKAKQLTKLNETEAVLELKEFRAAPLVSR